MIDGKETVELYLDTGGVITPDLVSAWGFGMNDMVSRSPSRWATDQNSKARRPTTQLSS